MMPYNLRKRKEPVAAPEVKAEPAKKKVARPRATATKKETTKKIESNHVTKPENKLEENHTIIEPEKTKVTTKPKAKKETKPRVTKQQEVKEQEEDKQEATQQQEELAKEESPKHEEEKIESSRNQLVFGIDSCGELGLGKIGIKKKAPTEVPIAEPIKQVACGPMHTLSLTESGQVYTYGCNDEGALGRVTDGDETKEATPELVPIKGTVIKVTAGDSHSAALTEDNEVYVWGNFRDEHGSVGLTPSSEGQAVPHPTQVLPEKKLKDIASGSNHMLLLDVDGVVYSFGVGAQGQLGRLSSDQVGSEKEGDSNAIHASNRELFLKPQPVSLKDVDPQRPFICDAIYAGNMSSFATNTDKKKNRLAGWGLNNYFQLGYKGQKGQLIQYHPRRSTFTCSTSMIDVACGQHHSLFLTKTGRVYSAGRHEYGMLGLGKLNKEVCPAKQIETLGNSIKQISAGINTSFAVSEEGKLYTWGMSGVNLGIDEEDKDLNVPTEMKAFGGRQVVQVAAGGSFTAVLIKRT